MDGNEEYKIRNINIDNFHIKEAQYPYYLMNTECINFTQSSVNGKIFLKAPKKVLKNIIRCLLILIYPGLGTKV